MQKLPLGGKTLFAYLWTNDHCNPAGLYEITPDTIAFETKLPEGDIPGLFELLRPKVVWYPEENLVWVKNFIKRQSKSSKFLQAVAKSLVSIHNNGTVKELLDYNLQRYSLSIPYQYYMDRVSILARVSASASVSGSGSGSEEEGIVKGEGELSQEDREIPPVAAQDEVKVLAVWSGVKGFPRDSNEATRFLTELRAEFPDVDILDVSKSWAAAKLSEPLTERSMPFKQLRAWMKKERQFAQERGGKTGGKQPRQKRIHPITYIRGSE